MAAAMQNVADEVFAAGRKAYIIPGGGSNPIGATGYVACAEEILTQSFELGLKIDRVVCASGSTGTHAGLVTGFYGNNADIPVIGINVSRTKADQAHLVYDLVAKPPIMSASTRPSRKRPSCVLEITWVPDIRCPRLK